MSPGLPTPSPLGAPTPRADCGPPPTALRPVAAAVLSSGNRCGHDPARPRWFAAPAHHAPHPRILVRLQEAVRSYFADPAVLPSLNAANGSARRQRSERREGCLALLGALVHYLDLASLRVGIPRADGGFEGLTLAFLAARAGLGQRRAERASRDLHKAGLVEVHPIAQKTEDDRHRGLPAVRRLPASLFKVFGLGRWLQRERDKAASRRRHGRRREESAASEADEGRRELALESARRRAAESAAAADPAAAAEAAEAAEAARRETARSALGALRTLLKGRPPG